MSSTRAPELRRRLAWCGFAIALLVQLAVLYAPSTGGVPSIPGADKVAHAVVFALPALLGMLAGIRPLCLGLALVAHAAASELVQHFVLPERSGDVWDAMADVAGVALGLAVGAALGGRVGRARRGAGPAGRGADAGSADRDRPRAS